MGHGTINVAGLLVILLHLPEQSFERAIGKVGRQLPVALQIGQSAVILSQLSLTLRPHDQGQRLGVPQSARRFNVFQSQIELLTPGEEPCPINESTGTVSRVDDRKIQVPAGVIKVSLPAQQPGSLQQVDMVTRVPPDNLCQRQNCIVDFPWASRVSASPHQAAVQWRSSDRASRKFSTARSHCGFPSSPGDRR